MSSIWIPRVTFGVPVYNGAKHIRSALDSLLAQTYTDFEIVISDNASADDTPKICLEYVERDKRVSFQRNARNLGMIRNFRQVFELSRGSHFAWASDHDLWHPRWLETMMKVLDENPDVILAYSRSVGMDDGGNELFKEPRTFDTSGMSKNQRVRAACTQMVGAGNIAYGLMRSNAFAKTSVYPSWLMPDRLLFMEMSLHGQYKQVDEYLWKRRYPDGIPNLRGVPEDYESIIERQRSNLFLGKAPWHTLLPTLAHALGLLYFVTLRSPSGNYSNAYLGPYMTYLYLRRRRQAAKAELRLLLRRMWNKLSTQQT
jgi:glycosyltransferase involved in cell wall biosynthesis